MPRSKTKLFKKEEHYYMKGKDLLEYIDRFAKAAEPSQSEFISMLFTYKAAWYAITGEELTNNSMAVVGSENLEQAAEILRARGSEKYARMAFANKKPLDTATDLDYNSFLRKNWNELAAEKNSLPIKPSTKEALDRSLSSRGDSGTCVDHISFDRPAKRTGAQLQLTNEDRFTYEYQASPEHWKTFTALSECMRRTGYKPLNDAAVASAMEDPINVCLLKNKQVTERLEKGDYKGVTDAYRKTKASFTFLNDETLKEAQSNARFIIDNMKNRDCDYAQTEEYIRLKDALADFCDAKDLDTAAQKSAEVLIAAEKFTKGRKSSWFKSDDDRSCVNDALNAIATAVPDAPNNPSVKPLVDRFNNVRWWRRQDPVFIIDYHQPSAISRYKTISLSPHAEEAAAPEQQNIRRQADSGYIRREMYGDISADEKSLISGVNDASFYNRFDTDKEDSPLMYKDEQLNDVQTALYGDEKPDLGKEYEDTKKKSGEPVKLANARSRMLPLMNSLAKMEAGKVKGIAEARFAEGLANLIALHITPPYPTRTDYINKLKLDETVNKYKSDPALMQLARDYKNDPKVMENFKKAAGDCLKSENPVVDFAKFINDRYTEKKLALEKQNEAVPQPEGYAAEF